MRKCPWGIIMGVCAILVFFLTAGVIAVHLIMNGIAAQTNETVPFLGLWYEVLMFVFDIVCFLGFAGSLTMYVLKARGFFGGDKASAHGAEDSAGENRA